MKTKHIARKASSIGTIAAAVLALSGQVSAADYSHLAWAGHFKEAYSGASQQAGGFISRSNTNSRVQDAPIWAGHFERAYGPPSARIGMVSGPGRQEVSEYLLWAGNFKQAYEASHEEATDEIRAIQLAMDRK
jgi:hypothetical protein